ncbi:hypothetical protein CC79DRAFT_1336389 [Sarocladium strictum]
MGGSAFSIGPDPLETPRMPPEVYSAVKAECQAKLQELFICVASPIEGPGKTDHGDIDILVTWPKKPFEDKNKALESVEKKLHAHRAILTIGETAANYAIPWPTETRTPEVTNRFIQVDVRICDNLETLQWILFKHAHGDIWNVLGSMIRPYGLTIDEEALYIRIPEIEDSNRKRAKVRLTDEPTEILQFLGLPLSNYWQEPFPNRQAMFRYAARCRLFWVRPAVPEDVVKATDAEVVGGSSEVDWQRLKSNDRRRMKGRPAFRAWIDEFVAECRRQGLYSAKPTTREALTEEALDHFRVRNIYNQRRTEYLLERQKERIVAMIKDSARKMVQGDMQTIAYRSCQVKALKRVVLEADNRYGITTPRDELQDGDGFYKEDVIQSFLREHAEEIGEAAWTIHCESGWKRPEKTSEA